MTGSRRWMNVSELADYLGLKPSTIYQYIGERRIPYYKKGHLVRFREEEIDRWMEASRVKTAEETLTEQLQRKD